MAYTKNNTPRFDWVDGVKAFAIIAILLNHVIELYTAGPSFSNPSYDWPPFTERMQNLIPAGSNIVCNLIIFLGWLGDMGPGVFILISGFTLALSQSYKKLSIGDFYKKRLLRIFPLYITIHLLVLAFLFHTNSTFSYNVTEIVLSLMGLRFNDFLFFFINPSWWFIWLILQLYLVFPFLFKLLNRNKKLFIIVTLLFTLISRMAGLLHLSYSDNLYYWMTGLFFGTRLFEFSFGLLLGVLYFQNSKVIFSLLNNPLRTLLISISIYLLGFLCSLTYYSTIVSNILITIGLSGLFYGFFSIFKNSQFLGRTLQWIGKQSFPVFLIHQPIILYLSRSYSGIFSLLYVILFLIASFPLGYILCKIIAVANTSFAKYKKRKEN
jgi:peptidoglycan/LPS O-acetylase OafA/YrhL